MTDTTTVEDATIEVKRFHQSYPGLPDLYHVYCSRCPNYGFCGDINEANTAAEIHGFKHLPTKVQPWTDTTEYTPTTRDIRIAVFPSGITDAEFDRWLAAHDASVRADQIEKDAKIVNATTPQGYSMNALAQFLDKSPSLLILEHAEAIANAIRAQLGGQS